VDHIKQALLKARAENGVLNRPVAPVAAPVAAPVVDAVAAPQVPEATNPGAAPAAATAWQPRRTTLDTGLLERNRVVAHEMKHPGHVAFNLLRTRTLKIMRDSGRKSIAVTSPTPGCGKTAVTTNLAFSLARSPNCRTVLVDLDLRRPSVARVLGVEAKGSVGEYLEGHCRAKDCFMEVYPNLVVATGRGSIRNSSELIHGEGIAVLLKFISERLAPDIVLFDLPPMHVSDDTIAFLPMADAALLVIAAGRTGAAEVIDCEKQIDHDEKLIGVVLNKCEVPARDYYGYY
jgi:protein-tyrosine kinase